MKKQNKAFFPTFIMILAMVMPSFAAVQTNRQADGIVVLVNGSPITNSDINKRIAFLKLQHHPGKLSQIARQELINETLRRQEISKRGITVSQAEIDKAYKGFASSNKMTVNQLNHVMNEAGVTPAHFKNYIRDQIGWGRLISARFQAESTVTPQDAVQRMLKDGGKKPSLNEYFLKQVILVVPASQRATSAKRLSEANIIRNKISSCDDKSLYVAAQDVKDVTVRNLGRFLEPQIPAEWEKLVRRTPAEKATQAQITKRGVEFLVVCSIQKVSDDRVAQLVFSMQDSRKGAERGAALEKKYMKELTSAATITTP